MEEEPAASASTINESCIRSVASRHRLRYVVLFGSEAGGYSGPHSDVDLAIKAGRSLTLAQIGLLHSELQECISKRLDLVVLDWWDPVIAWESLSRGRLVYACSRSCVTEYYLDLARALDEIADLEPLIELFRREARRALTRASSEGN